MHYSCPKCGADFYPSAPHENLTCPNNCGSNLVEHKEEGAFTAPPILTGTWTSSTTAPPNWVTTPFIIQDVPFHSIDAGRKDDHGKNPLELLPTDALEEIGKILQHGAMKYDPRNWEKGMSWGRIYGAALRHLFAWWRGEALDKDSGLSHISHAACCLLFLLTYSLRRVGTDDRPHS